MAVAMVTLNMLAFNCWPMDEKTVQHQFDAHRLQEAAAIVCTATYYHGAIEACKNNGISV